MNFLLQKLNSLYARKPSVDYDGLGRARGLRASCHINEMKSGGKTSGRVVSAAQIPPHAVVGIIFPKQE